LGSVTRKTTPDSHAEEKSGSENGPWLPGVYPLRHLAGNLETRRMDFCIARKYRNLQYKISILRETAKTHNRAPLLQVRADFGLASGKCEGTLNAGRMGVLVAGKGKIRYMVRMCLLGKNTFPVMSKKFFVFLTDFPQRHGAVDAQPFQISFRDLCRYSDFSVITKGNQPLVKQGV